MVMELIDGIDLASHLEDNGILSEEKALPIIKQVGRALSFVHKQGFTHLDVKPQNTMLRKRGLKAVLIDFGLARQMTAPGKLRTNSNSGTECYAPIELLEKRAEVGAYTDVYSLAATLYVMLTGELPFPSQFRKQNIALTPPKLFNSDDSDTEVWREFGEKVGWIKNGKWLCYNDLAFSEKAPEAHLPVAYDVDVTEDVWGGPSVYTGYGYSMTTMDIELVNSSLASRLDECNI
jgi:serine/threonine protein kinase